MDYVQRQTVDGAEAKRHVHDECRTAGTAQHGVPGVRAGRCISEGGTATPRYHRYDRTLCRETHVVCVVESAIKRT